MTLSKAIKDKILSTTLNQTEFFDLAEPYGAFRKLNVNVTPKLETVDFYGGERSPEESRYVPHTSQYLRGAEKHESNLTRFSTLSRLLKDFSSGQLCFIGPAGSGKTTLLKAITRWVVEGQGDPLFPNIEIVFFIQCRNFVREDKITGKHMLLSNIYPSLNEEDVLSLIQFIKMNPDKVLFVLDSLDTHSYTIDGVYKTLNIHEEASPECILWNFVSGKFFPGSRIITSSREHAIRNYNGEVRADKIVSLAGLTKESICKIVVGYFGEEEGMDTMGILETKSPSLLSLCAIPVFLVFTLIGLKSSFGFSPKTISGVMILVLQSILRSPHRHERYIEDVLKKLQKLSFFGTVKGQVQFQATEFGEYGITVKEARDLTIVAPKLKGKLFKGEEILFFAHQSLQETLTALYIARMPIEEFRDFVYNFLHLPRNAVIRRVLCGILLDTQVFDVAQNFLEDISDQKEKQDILKASIVEQLTGGKIRNQNDLLE
ncbi:uncharacterized protein LOC144431288 isoform X1 [Styela clava]